MANASRTTCVCGPPPEHIWPIARPTTESVAATEIECRVRPVSVGCVGDEDVAETVALVRDRHDQSKLESPEVEMFDEFTPKLRDLTYGSDEYKACTAAMGDALKHHYSVNRHHPEWHERGIRGMNLLDLTEMLADWKAATLRHADGDLERSIRQNAERFGYGDEIENLLMTTAKDLGWVGEPEMPGHTYVLEDYQDDSRSK